MNELKEMITKLNDSLSEYLVSSKPAEPTPEDPASKEQEDLDAQMRTAVFKLGYSAAFAKHAHNTWGIKYRDAEI